MQEVISKKPEVSVTQYRDPVIVDYPLTEADDEKIAQLKKEAGINIYYNLKKELMIYAHHYIGSVEFSNFILRVDPSFVNISNIGRLYDFANEIDPVTTVRPPGTIKFTDEYNHPLEELVNSFVAQCQKIMKTGIYKSYQTKDESISTLKGKLMLKHQIINLSKFNLKFHCEFDEFTPNNLENVILLDCLNTCQRITKNETAKMDIRKMIHRISVEVESKTVGVHDFKKLRYTRLNKNYEDAHKVAKSIIMQRGLMNWNEMRTSFVHPLFIQTWELFEQLVARLFDKYYDLRSKKQPKTESTAWKQYYRETYLGSTPMKPDLIVYKKSGVRNEKVAFIADAKLKDSPAVGDFYQVSFYLRKYGIRKGYFLVPHPGKSGKLIDLGLTWKAELQDIELQEVMFDVDGILDAIWSGREDEIKQRLIELIPPKDFV